MIIFKISCFRRPLFRTFQSAFSTEKFKWLPPPSPKHLKDTAEKAVTAFTALWFILYSNQDNFFKEESTKTATIQLSHSSSMRERVLQLLKELRVENQNKQQIINAFTIRKGIKINRHTINSQRQRIFRATQKQDMSNLVFCPTFLPREIVSNVSGLRNKIRFMLGMRFLVGEYGIGKSINQLMLSYLTTLLWRLKIYGTQGQKELNQIVEKNRQLFTYLISFVDFEQKSQQEKTLTERLIAQIKKIPYLPYYVIPIKKKYNQDFFYKDIAWPCFENNVQIENLQSFASKMEEVASSYKIPIYIIVDQSNKFFSAVRQYAKDDPQAIKTPLQTMWMQYSLLKNIFDNFCHFSGIIFACSQSSQVHLLKPELFYKIGMDDELFDKKEKYVRDNLIYSNSIHKKQRQIEMFHVLFFEIERLILQDKQSNVIQFWKHSKKYFLQKILKRDQLKFWRNDSKFFTINRFLNIQGKNYIKEIQGFLQKAAFQFEKQKVQQQEGKKLKIKLFENFQEHILQMVQKINNLTSSYQIDKALENIKKSQRQSVKKLFLIYLVEEVKNIERQLLIKNEDTESFQQITITPEIVNRLLQIFNFSIQYQKKQLSSKQLQILHIFFDSSQSTIQYDGSVIIRKSFAELYKQLYSLRNQLSYPQYNKLQFQNFQKEEYLVASLPIHLEVFLSRMLSSTKISVRINNQIFQIVNRKPLSFQRIDMRNSQAQTPIHKHNFQQLFDQAIYLPSGKSLGAFPTTNNRQDQIKNLNFNNPFFDLLIIKRNPPTSQKRFTLYMLDFTLAKNKSQYDTKIKNLKRFQEKIYNHPKNDFFKGMVEVQHWFLCLEKVAQLRTSKGLPQECPEKIKISFVGLQTIDILVESATYSQRLFFDKLKKIIKKRAEQPLDYSDQK